MKNFLGSAWKQVPVKIDDNISIPGQLGIVAKKSDGDESWKAYMGVTLKQQTEIEDVITIIESGVPLPEEDARLWFPDIKLPYRS